MDWKERFKIEYQELCDRYSKLGNMLAKMREGTLEFTPKCSYDLLHEQYVYMGCYKAILECRAEIEGVRINQ